jgi:hypothetical protein
MTNIAPSPNKKVRMYHRAGFPANHSQEARFGKLDGAVIVFFLLCVAGLLCFLMA